MRAFTRTIVPAGIAALCVALPLGAQRGTNKTPTIDGATTGRDAGALPMPAREPEVLPEPIILIDGKTDRGDVVTSVRDARINAKGEVALEVDLADSSIAILRNGGGAPGGLTTVAKSTDFFGRDGFTLANLEDDGRITFTTSRGTYHAARGHQPTRLGGHEERPHFARTRAEWLMLSSDSGVFAGPSAAPAAILRPGDQAPGIPDPIRFGGVEKVYDARGNGMVFTGRLNGATESPALFLLRGESVELAARSGSSSTLGIAKVTNASVNSSGTVVVEGDFDGRPHFWHGRPGAFHRINDDRIPHDGEFAVLDDDQIIVANTKHVIFGRAEALEHYTLPPGVIRTHVTHDNFAAIIRKRNGAHVLHAGHPTTSPAVVARTGDTVKMRGGETGTITDAEPRVISMTGRFLVTELGVEATSTGGAASKVRGIFVIPVKAAVQSYR